MTPDPSDHRPWASPQTTGKVERFQQTLKNWLRRQDHTRGLARDLAELQGRLDEFGSYYNEQRPHQGIGRVTPLSRWTAAPRSTPAASPLEHPAPRPQRHTVVVDGNGAICMRQFAIGVAPNGPAPPSR